MRSFCFLKARCVKCTDHQISNCPLKEFNKVKDVLREGDSANHKDCMVYKDLQFLPALWRKVKTFKPQLQIKPVNIQTRSTRKNLMVQSQELKVDNKFLKIITGNNISKFGTIYNKQYTKIKIYKRVHRKNGLNVKQLSLSK